MPEPFSEEVAFSSADQGESPLHGYRGEEVEAPSQGVPAGLTIAISREAGSRGGTVAKRAGENLGWDVYSQEMLGYLSQNGPPRQALLDKLTPAGNEWIDEHLHQLLHEQNLSRNPSILDLARLILLLGV